MSVFTHRRLAAVLLLTLSAGLLLTLFWKQILAGVGIWVCLRALLHLHRPRRRRSSMAQTITACSTLLTAWNTRWRKPDTFPSRWRRARGAWDNPDGTVGLSEEERLVDQETLRVQEEVDDAG